MTPPDTLPTIRYRVQPHDLQAHLFQVELVVDSPSQGLTLALPTWIPGSYLIREFAQHLQDWSAELDGQAARLTQTAKNRWTLSSWAPPDAGPPRQLVVRYRVYAFDTSVRTAWLDAQRGFFNGTSLLLRVEGRDHGAHELDIQPPFAPPAGPAWRLATALLPHDVDDRGFGRYRASTYAELVDAPVEMGAFWDARFEVRGVPHRWVVAGAPPHFDGARLVEDTRRIAEAAMTLWHGADGRPPFDRYVFLLNATHDGHGGLEHTESTALLCPRQSLPTAQTPVEPKATDGYTQLLGLISHEYFHTWNVKRLKPAALARIDFDQENLTDLLWFFEGFTSYYDDLLVLRAGRITEATYLQLLGKTIQQVDQTPGRRIQSAAQASLDAWTRYYRVHENTPNATVSYYTKGAVIALCLDLTLRAKGSDLDAVMRGLWERTGGGPMTEADLVDELNRQAAHDWADCLRQWVHGTGDLPWEAALQQHGVRVRQEPAALAQRLGLRVKEAGGLTVTHVLRGGPAERAGMASGDEWLAVETPDGRTWRVFTLADVSALVQPNDKLQVWIGRDRLLHRCALVWPATDSERTAQLLPAEPSPSPAAENEGPAARGPGARPTSRWPWARTDTPKPTAG